jgi:serine/threonine-protein kinase
LKKGDQFEGYRILGELGRGAASIIYVAEEQRTKRVVCLKHVEKLEPKHQRFIEQTLQEHKVSQDLSHQAFRRSLRAIKKGPLLRVNEVWLVLEMVDGTSMELSPPRTFEDALVIFQQVADGLSHMHQRGWVHADMKPNNIVVTPSDNEHGLVSKIIDLGQSCRTGTVKERIQGTPDYIAPEQVHRREITARTDVYNLGATMYWVLTRQHIPTALPKRRESLMSSLDDSMIEPPKPASDLNPRIEERLNSLIMQCVRVKPEERPGSMDEIAERLRFSLGVIRTKNQRRKPTDPRATYSGRDSSDDSRVGA